MLRNRATNLEAKMNDGTTPLILAAKHDIPDIVKDLLKAGVKVSNTDSHGKFVFVVVHPISAVSGSNSWLTDSFSFQ